MANMPKSRKLLVRTALVTGSTIATMIGAQTLALTDQHLPVSAQSSVPAQALNTSTNVSNDVAVDQHKTIINVEQPASVQNSHTNANASPVTITHVAPTIIILSGDSSGPVSSNLLSGVADATSVPLVSTSIPQPTPTDTVIVQPTPQIIQNDPQYYVPNPIVVPQFPSFRTNSSR